MDDAGNTELAAEAIYGAIGVEDEEGAEVETGIATEVDVTRAVDVEVGAEVEEAYFSVVEGVEV